MRIHNAPESLSHACQTNSKKRRGFGRLTWQASDNRPVQLLGIICRTNEEDSLPRTLDIGQANQQRTLNSRCVRWILALPGSAHVVDLIQEDHSWLVFGRMLEDRLNEPSTTVSLYQLSVHCKPRTFQIPRHTSRSGCRCPGGTTSP